MRLRQLPRPYIRIMSPPFGSGDILFFAVRPSVCLSVTEIISEYDQEMP